DDYKEAQDYYDKAPSASDMNTERPEYKAPEPYERPKEEPSVTPPYAFRPVNSYPGPGAPMPGLPKGAFLEVFKSKAFVVLIISLVLYAVINAIGAFSRIPSNTFMTLSSVYGNILSDADIANLVNGLRVGMIIGGVVDLIPMILAIIALFMINSSRFDRPLISGGFSLGRAYAILMMIINIIAYGLVAAAFIVAGIFSYLIPTEEIDAYISEIQRLLPGSYRINISGFMISMIAGLLFTIAGVIIAVMVFRIIYYAKMQSSFKKMRLCCAEMEVKGRYPSSFVGVYAIIIAAFAFLATPFTIGDYITGLSLLFFIMSRISFAVLIFTMRKTMKMCDR
ncbi:MAG: hypothetical protein ILP10_09080, partial [Lachnospiraceae bacterium]|nr:hypothetical protein [Lachnospiraceae bacterium]